MDYMWITHLLVGFVVLSMGLSMVTQRPPSRGR